MATPLTPSVPKSFCDAALSLGLDYEHPLGEGTFLLHTDTSTRSDYNSDTSASIYTVIKGYTVRLSDDAEARRLRAVVMITADPKQAERVAAEMRRMPEVLIKCLLRSRRP